MLHLGRPAVCVTKLDEGAARGFPRSALPQIANATDFVSFLTHGGDGVRAAAARVAPLSLMPIERHISLAKARKIARSILRVGWHPRKDEAIVVADDRHILDGHHRWAAMVLLQRPLMDVMRVETGINTLLRLAAAYVRHDRANVPGRPTFVGQPASSARVRSPLLSAGGRTTSAAAPRGPLLGGKVEVPLIGLGHKASLAQLVHDLEEALRRTENYNSTDVDPEWARHRQAARAASVAIEAARADVVSCETAAAIAGAGTAGAGTDGDTCAGPAARITPLSATFHRSLEGMWGVVRRQDAMERELSTREAAVRNAMRNAMRANEVQATGQVSSVQSVTAGGGSSSGTPSTTSAAISPSSSSASSFSSSSSASSTSSSSSASPPPPSSPASSSSKARPPPNAPGLSAAAATATAAAREAALSLPLHTHGRWIVGADGRRVKLACGSWAGGEQKDMVPAGLDRQRLPVIARAIKAMGLNCVRLLWANDMLSLKVREGEGGGREGTIVKW
jgi:hypothetical protein